MNNLNSVLVEGNLVRDPVLRSTPNGSVVCNICVATNRYFKNDGNMEKEVGFYDVEVWGKLGENIEKDARKGRGVRVVGRLAQDRWTDKEGKSHVKVKVVAEHVELRPEIKKTQNVKEEPYIEMER